MGKMLNEKCGMKMAKTARFAARFIVVLSVP
jgi:hypothetical protein